jgi:hypothetical protein
MCRSTIAESELVPWGSNYTFAVLLTDPHDDHPDTLAIYKPMAGEIPLWDFPHQTLYKREYAAYLVSQALGWNFIPATVIREGPHGIGSVQLYVEPEPNAHYFSFRDDHHDELKRIALFDLVTNNADRKAGHCLRGKRDGKIWGIDHGLTFNEDPKLRTVIWEFQAQPVDETLLQDLALLLEDDALTKQLTDYLAEREVAAFHRRLRRLISEGCFPSLQSRRDIPWGW